MSLIDENFISMCTNVLEHGTTTEGQKVRPHWPDGTPAYTIKTFGVVTRYDLQKEFPVLTLRKTPVKSALDELLWIWQKKSNKISELHSGVWDEWADENGTIGKAYGYQMAVKHRYYDINEEGLRHAFGDAFVQNIPETKELTDQLIPQEEETKLAHAVKGPDGAWYMDQVDRVIYDLKNNPFSRRIMTGIYTFSDLHAMNLYPCAYSMTFNVSGKTLNAILNQRSQDMLTANNWNVCQYACLVYMLAQVSGLEAGELVHVIADAHIYDRHIPLVNEILEKEEFDAPKLVIDKSVTDFYSFTPDSLTLENYQYNLLGKKVPVAI